MTKQQTQRLRRQLAATVRKEFATFLKTLPPAYLEAIFARAIANRRAHAGQEG